MTGSLTTRERLVRVALGLFLAFIAVHVGLTGPGVEPTAVAWGALALAVCALTTAAIGTAGVLSRVGLHADWSMAFLAARLYVGWEFLYAGWDKASNSWFSGAGETEVHGLLLGAVGQSHASAQNPNPGVAGWFASLADHVFLPHSELLSYLLVTAELCVGIGLILGLLLRASSFFAVALNSLFMFAGVLSAGLNPLMLLLGMGILLATAPGVRVMSVDGYLWHLLSGIRRRPRTATTTRVVPTT